ncbi:MAG: DUF6448 family protein [Armatimonadota bacterium]
MGARAAVVVVLMVVGASGLAFGHCDTMDGPVVLAAQAALEQGDVRLVLMWVEPEAEAEIRETFAQVQTVRALGEEARELADRHFFETLVRLHRAGEGEPYTGLKPAGTPVPEGVAAADAAIAAGSLMPVQEMLRHALMENLQQRFDAVLAARDFAPGDVEAGRRFVAAYVSFVHYVEGLHAAIEGTAGQGEEAPVHAH